MSVERGLKRIGMVVAIFWVAGWSFVAWQGHMQMKEALSELAELDKQYPEAKTLGTIGKIRVLGIDAIRYSDMENQFFEGEDTLDRALKIGLYVPLFLLILSPFGWFIYRGFKPKPPPQNN